MRLRVPRLRPRVLLAGAAAIIGAGVLVIGASAADPRLRECGGTGGARVEAAFSMAHASDFWDHFPNALGAPELRSDLPAYVVVFNGPVDLLLAGNPRGGTQSGLSTRQFVDVVCVLVGGVPNFYVDVDTTGYHI